MCTTLQWTENHQECMHQKCFKISTDYALEAVCVRTFISPSQTGGKSAWRGKSPNFRLRKGGFLWPWVDLWCQIFFSCPLNWVLKASWVFQNFTKSEEAVENILFEISLESWLWVKFHGESKFLSDYGRRLFFAVFGAGDFQLHASKLVLVFKFYAQFEFWSNLIID
jgi:hypothetical protein